MKTIIAALALEGEDDPVVARAARLARQHGARLILVHVIEDMAAGDPEAFHALDAGAVSAVLERDAADRAGAIAGDLGIEPEIVIAQGKPFEVVCDLADRRKADIVVIGPGKARTLSEKMFGSTADRIVRSATVPVLVVRSRAAAPYRRVVVAVDLSPQSLSASRAARALAPEATIEHLHVVEVPLPFEQALLRTGTPTAEIERYRQERLAAARRRLEAAFAAEDKSESFKLRLVHGDAQNVVARWSRNHPTDLVALGTHGRNVVSQMLLGSVARSVLQSTACDVLVVPE